MRVYFVDDQADKRLAGVKEYVEALREERIDLGVTTTADEALLHVERNSDPEDIVVLDIMMDRDIEYGGARYRKASAGFAVLRSMRKKGCVYERVPVLILTNRDPNDTDFSDHIKEELPALLKVATKYGSKKLYPSRLAHRLREIVEAFRAEEPLVGRTTFPEFIKLVGDEQKADLIDGVIYMASPESLEHNDLVVRLVMVPGEFIKKHGLGRLTVNRVAYRLSDNTSPEPDLAFIQTDRLDIVERGYVNGAPDLAVEIVSPDSVDRDYELKRSKYESAGVCEYWILDPQERKAMFLVRSSVGRTGLSPFREAELDGTVFRSTVLSGFSLDVAWLWQ